MGSVDTKAVLQRSTTHQPACICSEGHCLQQYDAMVITVFGSYGVDDNIPATALLHYAHLPTRLLASPAPARDPWKPHTLRQWTQARQKHTPTQQHRP